MKNRFLKISSLIATILLGTVSITSCGFIGEDPYSIEKIEVSDLENGNKLLTIKYTESAEMPSVSFEIPKGTTGNDGNGIRNVTSVHDSKNNNVIITIQYTDLNMKDTIITVPVNNGLDGAGLDKVEVKNIDGDQHLTLIYTDGREPTELIIPKGEKGDKGDGISNINVTIDEITQDIVVEIILDNQPPVTFPIPAGKAGIGIKEMTLESETDDSFVFMIKFTNLKITRITIAKPHVSKWLYGINDPSNSIGQPGDFYFNTYEGTIWAKEVVPVNNPEEEIKTIWKFLFKLEGTNKEENVVKHKIKLDLNGGTSAMYEDGSLVSSLSFLIPHGETFKKDEIPLAVKEGYDFIGWYTSVTLNPNSGKLTYTTPICNDMIFYAQYAA